MSIFLTVLKITGIVLGSLLGLILLLVLLLLFYPFHYRVTVQKHEEFTARAKLFWLLHIISAVADYSGGVKYDIKVCGISLYDLKAWREKRDNKKSRKKRDESLTSEEADALRKEKSGKPEDKKAAKARKSEDKDVEVVKDSDENKSEDERKLTEDRHSKDKKSEASEEKTSKEKSSKEKPSQNSKIKRLKSKFFRKKKITFGQFLDELDDRIFDFIIDLPDKIAAFWDNITGKIEEYINTIDYYDRLLGSKGSEEVIKMTKYRVGKILKPLIPRRLECTLDYSDDDPGNVAKMWQYYALSIPWREGIPGYFYMNAVQGDKNVEVDLKIKGYFFLGPILWHTGLLVLNKKFKQFIKRLKREES